MTPLGGSREQRGESTRTSSFWNDERSQSVVIGTILVFALGVALLGLLQVTLIPSANEDVEAQHSQQVRGEMQDLRNDIVRSAGSGADFSQGVKLGTDYPTRAFFLNPGPAAGSINTQATTDGTVDLNITHAEALNDETADYWNGSTRDYGTGAVVYRPGYNIYSNAPEATVIENSLVYSQFDDNTLLASDQRFVRGRTISLIALDGSLSQSQVNQYTVDTTAASASSNTISVENTTDENITINVSTRLSEEVLIEDVLSGQIDDPDGGAEGAGLEASDTTCGAIDSSTADNDRYIADCTFNSGTTFNNITLVMEQNETYKLKLAKVGVGNGATDTSVEYITDVQGNDTTVLQGTSRELVVQTRDRYNNPIAGETVTFSLSEGNGTLFTAGEINRTINVTTDANGEASVGYQAPTTVSGASTPVEVDVSYTANARPVDSDSDFDAQEPDDMTFRLEAINSSQTSSFTPLINPVDTLKLDGAEATNGPDCGTGGGGGASKRCLLTVKWNNTGGTDRTIQQMRYVYFSGDSQGLSGSADKGGLVVSEFNSPEDDAVASDPELIRGAGQKDTPDIVIGPGSTREINFVLYNDLSNAPGTSDANIKSGDFIVITLNVDGERETYFINPERP